MDAPLQIAVVHWFVSFVLYVVCVCVCVRVNVCACLCEHVCFIFSHARLQFYTHNSVTVTQ
jgi:hypothetical protein